MNEMRAQRSVVGAVKVVCRSLGGPGEGGGLRRPLEHQRRASMDIPLRRVSSEIDDIRVRCVLQGLIYS